MRRTYALIAKYGERTGLVLKRAPFVNQKREGIHPTIAPRAAKKFTGENFTKKNVKQNLPKFPNNKKEHAWKKNKI